MKTRSKFFSGAGRQEAARGHHSGTLLGPRHESSDRASSNHQWMSIRPLLHWMTVYASPSPPPASTPRFSSARCSDELRPTFRGRLMHRICPDGYRIVIRYKTSGSGSSSRVASSAAAAGRFTTNTPTRTRPRVCRASTTQNRPYGEWARNVRLRLRVTAVKRSRTTRQLFCRKTERPFF